MKDIRLIWVGVLGAGLLLSAAPRAFAYAQSDGTASAGQLTYNVPIQTVRLSPIVVNGQRLILPLFLQMVKTALHRPWSSSQADKNKLVCRFRVMLGSHMQTLHCMTNGQYFQQQDKTQEALLAASHDGYTSPIYYALVNGQIPVSIANYTSEHRVSRGELMVLLKKLPPRGSSYTLRITNHGKPVMDYVIKKGKLKAVRHYIYKHKGKD